MKTKVSSKVVELLEKVNDMNYDEIEHKLYNFMDCLRQKNILSAFFKQNNLTVQKVIDCFENGWEEEYEFQVGDVVTHEKISYPLFVKQYSHLGNVELVDKEGNRYCVDHKLTLIAKSINREDLKQC